MNISNEREEKNIGDILRISVYMAYVFEQIPIARHIDKNFNVKWIEISRYNMTIQRYDISVEAWLCHRSLSSIIDSDNLS